jgi:hypothetical protein
MLYKWGKRWRCVTQFLTVGRRGSVPTQQSLYLYSVRTEASHGCWTVDNVQAQILLHQMRTEGEWTEHEIRVCL